MDDALPPEFDALMDELASQPEPVRELWRYAMALVLIDNENARVVGSMQNGDGKFLCLRLLDGREFWVKQPALSEDVEQMMLHTLRQIADEDSVDKNDAQ